MNIDYLTIGETMESRPLLEVDQTSDDDLIDAITQLKEDGISFAEIMRELRHRFGNTYDSKRAASIARDIP